MVIWLTGLSGSGKSTIADLLILELKRIIPNVFLIDGDVVRELFGASLGFDEDSRKLQIGRIQKLAQFIVRQDFFVIVSALYSHPELMKWNRDNLPGYFEVYIDTPLQSVIARDTKGLYAQALSGKLKNVVGIDIPWHEPSCPNMVVKTDGVSPEEVSHNILDSIAVPIQNFIMK